MVENGIFLEAVKSLLLTLWLYLIVYYLKMLDNQALLLPSETLKAGRGRSEVKLHSGCGVALKLVGFSKADARDYKFLNPYSLTEEDLNIEQHPRKKCSDFKTAIIIPYRDRVEQLSVFLQHMVPIFERQNLNYEIFVIEQDKETLFNRALLLNIGYTEAKKHSNFTCYVFSDVDFLLEDDRVSYTCIDSPMHLMARADSYGYKLPYLDYCGGVFSLWGNHFEDVNGYPNNFWGWGSEDDEFCTRLRRKGMQIKRLDFNLVAYHENRVSHKRHDFNSLLDRVRKMLKRVYNSNISGLNNLKYIIEETKRYHLMTHIKVNVSIML